MSFTPGSSSTKPVRRLSLGLFSTSKSAHSKREGLIDSIVPADQVCLDPNPDRTPDQHSITPREPNRGDNCFAGMSSSRSGNPYINNSIYTYANGTSRQQRTSSYPPEDCPSDSECTHTYTTSTGAVGYNYLGDANPRKSKKPYVDGNSDPLKRRVTSALSNVFKPSSSSLRSADPKSSARDNQVMPVSIPGIIVASPGTSPMKKNRRFSLSPRGPPAASPISPTPLSALSQDSYNPTSGYAMKPWVEQDPAFRSPFGMRSSSSLGIRHDERDPSGAGLKSSAASIKSTKSSKSGISLFLSRPTKFTKNSKSFKAASSASSSFVDLGRNGYDYEWDEDENGGRMGISPKSPDENGKSGLGGLFSAMRKKTSRRSMRPTPPSSFIPPVPQQPLSVSVSNLPSTMSREPAPVPASTVSTRTRPLTRVLPPPPPLQLEESAPTDTTVAMTDSPQAELPPVTEGLFKDRDEIWGNADNANANPKSRVSSSARKAKSKRVSSTSTDSAYSQLDSSMSSSAARSTISGNASDDDTPATSLSGSVSGSSVSILEEKDEAGGVQAAEGGKKKKKKEAKEKRDSILDLSDVLSYSQRTSPESNYSVAPTLDVLASPDPTSRSLKIPPTQAQRNTLPSPMKLAPSLSRRRTSRPEHPPSASRSHHISPAMSPPVHALPIPPNVFSQTLSPSGSVSSSTPPSARTPKAFMEITPTLETPTPITASAASPMSALDTSESPQPTRQIMDYVNAVELDDLRRRGVMTPPPPRPSRAMRPVAPLRRLPAVPGSSESPPATSAISPPLSASESAPVNFSRPIAADADTTIAIRPFLSRPVRPLTIKRKQIPSSLFEATPSSNDTEAEKDWARQRREEKKREEVALAESLASPSPANVAPALKEARASPPSETPGAISVAAMIMSSQLAPGTPSLSRSPSTLSPTGHVLHGPRSMVKSPRHVHAPHIQTFYSTIPISDLPGSVLDVVVAYLVPRDTASLTRVSKLFLEVGRRKLYGAIDNVSPGFVSDSDGPCGDVDKMSMGCLKTIVSSAKLARVDMSLGKHVKVVRWRFLDPTVIDYSSFLPLTSALSPSNMDVIISQNAVLSLFASALQMVPNVEAIYLHLPSSILTTHILNKINSTKIRKVELRGLSTVDAGVAVAKWLERRKTGGGDDAGVQELSLPETYYLPIPPQSSRSEASSTILTPLKTFNAPLSLLLSLPLMASASESTSGSTASLLPRLECLTIYLTSSLTDGALLPSSLVSFLSMLPPSLQELNIGITKRVDMETHRLVLEEVGRILGCGLENLGIEWVGRIDDLIQQLSSTLLPFRTLNTLTITLSPSTISSSSAQSSSSTQIKFLTSQVPQISALCGSLKKLQVLPMGMVWEF